MARIICAQLLKVSDVFLRARSREINLVDDFGFLRREIINGFRLLRLTLRARGRDVVEEKK
jgi:hypothetical protein